MGRPILFTEQAKRDLRTIHSRNADQIQKILLRFAESGEGDVRRLQAIQPPQFRLRVQNHRVIFRYEGTSIVVLRIRDRKDVYR